MLVSHWLAEVSADICLLLLLRDCVVVVANESHAFVKQSFGITPKKDCAPERGDLYPVRYCTYVVLLYIPTLQSLDDVARYLISRSRSSSFQALPLFCQQKSPFARSHRSPEITQAIGEGKDPLASALLCINNA